MKIKKGIIIVFFFIIAAFLSKAAMAADIDKAHTFFYKGNSSYREGKFDEAVNSYENALKTGYESGPLYYNLGNAYFKKGFLGKAILNYLRAKRLMPEDADLKSNLEYARSLIKKRIMPKPKNRFTKSFLAVANYFTLDSITLVCSVLYFSLAGFFVFILLKKPKRPFVYAGVAVSFFFILSVALFLSRIEAALAEKAVIIEKKAPCRFEPFGNATVFFTLNEGQDVDIISAERGWVKIRRPDSKEGWVKEKDLGRL